MTDTPLTRERTKLYVLTHCYDYDPGSVSVVGVFVSQDEAEHAAQELKPNADITEHEVEGIFLLSDRRALLAEAVGIMRGVLSLRTTNDEHREWVARAERFIEEHG